MKSMAAAAAAAADQTKTDDGQLLMMMMMMVMTSVPPPPPPNFAEGSRSSKLETGEQREKLNLEKKRESVAHSLTDNITLRSTDQIIRRRREGKRQKHTTCHWSRRQ